MNRKEMVRRVAQVLRDNEFRKPISIPKQVFHISDDEGNSKDFIVKKSEKGVLLTADDIEAVIEACEAVMKDALRHGEDINARGFGTLSLKYRKARATKHPETGEDISVDARYVPKFTFGNELRMCAKFYEASLDEKLTSLPDVATSKDREEL